MVHPSPSVWTTALRCRCPRCGTGPLFDGLLAVRPRCRDCGLNLSDADAGDGPAVFVMMILGFLVVGLALWVEFTFEPPLWVHVVLWAPFISVAGVGLLRVLKAWLIGQTFRHRPERFSG